MTEEKYDRGVCCLFTGHRALPDRSDKKGALSALQRKTEDAVRAAYAEGFRVFFAGGARGFDTLASLAVVNLKGELPGIRLVLALPHFGHYQRWTKTEQAIFAEILQRADEVIYVSKEYDSGCMHKRNRYMANRCALCICYCGKRTGGTAYTVRYAEENGLKIVNLYGNEL